jgi:hypothetical protein
MLRATVAALVLVAIVWISGSGLILHLHTRITSNMNLELSDRCVELYRQRY